jgi:hypothetical protein
MHGWRGLQLRRSTRVISLIVPCWKDEEHAIEFAEKWANHPLIREVIVAAVRDQSHLQQPNGKIKRCQSDLPGRGSQLNLGAKIATWAGTAIPSCRFNPERGPSAIRSQFDARSRFSRRRVLSKIRRTSSPLALAGKVRTLALSRLWHDLRRPKCVRSTQPLLVDRRLRAHSFDGRC